MLRLCLKSASTYSTFFITSYCGFRFTSAKNSIKFCSAVSCCLWRCPTNHPRTNTLGHNALVFCYSWDAWGQDPQSWVGWGNVSFQQKYPPGSVLRCPTAAENGVMTKGLCPAYNVEPVTNTSSSSCANNGRRTPR